jgi:hypothetical protein
MKKNLRELLYYLSLLAFSIKIPFLGITGPYLLSLVGVLRPKGISREYLIFWILLIAYFILIYAVNIFTADVVEFWKSLINIVLFAPTFSLVSYLFKNNKISYKFLRYISIGIFIFAVIQVVALVWFKDDSYFFLLDPISISTADDVGRFQAANLMWYMRPVSIYHEPSFFGLVSLVLLHVHYVRTNKLNYINILAIILSMSSTAIAFLLLYLVWQQTALLKVFGLAVLGVLMVTFYSYTRLDEVLQPGTSGHERLVKPILDLWVNYARNFLAVPVGNLFPQTNNSMQLLFAYLGIASLLLIPLALKIYRILPVVLCILFTNGAFLTPDGAILLATACYAKAKR